MAKRQSKTVCDELSQTPDNSTDIKPLTNRNTWIDFIKNDAYMEFPEKQDWRNRFIFTLLEWASKHDSLEIVDFAIEMKMRREQIYVWAQKYPDIGQAYEQAKLIIASRRRKGAMLKKLDGAYAYKDMHVYDSEWLAINKYHSDMKKEEEKQAHTFIINDAKPRIVSKEEMIGEKND